MRTTNLGFFNSAVGNLRTLQADVNALQEQVATGRRIQRPSDDPNGAARILDYRESLATLDQFQRNTELARGRLQLAEETLTQVTNTLQRVRELTLQASNASQTNETRGFIARELEESVEALLGLANARDASDQYLFSGFQAGVQAYSRNGDVFTYNGDGGQRLVQVSGSRSLADSNPGSEIFSNVREGNGQVLALAGAGNTGTGVVINEVVGQVSGYDFSSFRLLITAPGTYEVQDSGGTTLSTGVFTSSSNIDVGPATLRIDGEPAVGDEFLVQPSPNRDVFSIVTDIASALQTGSNDATSRAVLDNIINRGLNGVDQAIEQVLDVRTSIGARLAAAESQEDTNAGTELVLREALANVEDLDLTEAVSNLANQVASLEAAQQSFIRVQQLSLFNFL